MTERMTTSRRLRSMRSATTPANGAKIIIGMKLQKKRMPSQAADLWVMSAM